MSRFALAARVCAAALLFTSTALAAAPAPEIVEGSVDQHAALLRDLGRQLRFLQHRDAGLLDEVRSPLSAVLRTHADVLRGIKFRGTATAEYWMVMAVDMALVGRSVGTVFGLYKEEIAGLPLATRIAVKREVARMKGMSASGTGDVNYWIAVARANSVELKGIAEKLDGIADQLDEEESDVDVSTRIALHGLSRLVDLIPVTGTGYAEFWLRTCYDQVENAHAVADAIDELAGEVQNPVHDLVGEETEGIRELKVQGTGGPAYWLAYANALRSELIGHEEILEELINELDSDA